MAEDILFRLLSVLVRKSAISVKDITGKPFYASEFCRSYGVSPNSESLAGSSFIYFFFVPKSIPRTPLWRFT